MKKFILNADDFGISIHHNLAVLEGYQKGILKSASLCTNFDAFDDAINNVIPKCKDLGLAIHLNIQEGKSLTNCPLLTDSRGYFNRGYLYLILNQHNKELLKQIKQEFKAQIVKGVEKINIDHLDSHVHTHAIPEIFKIVCELAKEFNINSIRTQNEIPYLIPTNKLHFINLLKIILLKYYTFKNKKLLKKYSFKTNDFILGVGYTGMMDSFAIEYGLKKLLNKNCVIEALIHPCKYENLKIDSHIKEFEITQDLSLLKKIKELGFEIVNYRSI